MQWYTFKNDSADYKPIGSDWGEFGKTGADLQIKVRSGKSRGLALKVHLCQTLITLI